MSQGMGARACPDESREGGIHFSQTKATKNIKPKS